MDETTMTEEQATTQAKPMSAWEQWNAAVQRFLAFEEKVTTLQMTHELVKAYRKESGDTHTEK